MADVDRSTWLGRVGRALDASPEVEADVLAELAAHLDDEEADGVAHGLDPVTASRRAVGRLGDPGSLGHALRRAHRTPRAALGIAGGGAIAIGGYSVLGAVLCMLAILAVDTIARLLGGGVRGLVPASAPGAYAGFAAVAIGLTYAAHVAPATIVRSSAWSIRSVRRRLAAGAIVVGVPVALLLPGQELDAWLAVAYLLAPLAVAAAALRAPATPTFRPGAVTLAFAAAVLALPLVAWPADDTAVTPPRVQPADAAALGRPAEDVPSGLMPTSSSAWSGGDGSASTTGISFDDLNGWRNLGVELWALEQAADGAWRYGQRPLLRVPFAVEGSTATATIVPPRPRTPTWVARVIVGTAADGVRSQYGGVDVEQLPPWRGSVLDWWSGR